MVGPGVTIVGLAHSAKTRSTEVRARSPSASRFDGGMNPILVSGTRALQKTSSKAATTSQSVRSVSHQNVNHVVRSPRNERMRGAQTVDHFLLARSEDLVWQSCKMPEHPDQINSLKKRRVDVPRPERSHNPKDAAG